MQHLKRRILHALNNKPTGLTVAELSGQLEIEKDAVERAIGDMLRYMRPVTSNNGLYYLLNGEGLRAAEKIAA